MERQSNRAANLDRIGLKKLKPGKANSKNNTFFQRKDLKTKGVPVALLTYGGVYDEAPREFYVGNFMDVKSKFAVLAFIVVFSTNVRGHYSGQVELIQLPEAIDAMPELPGLISMCLKSQEKLITGDLEDGDVTVDCQEEILVDFTSFDGITERVLLASASAQTNGVLD